MPHLLLSDFKPLKTVCWWTHIHFKTSSSRCICFEASPFRLWYRSIITPFSRNITVPAWCLKLKDRWRQKRAERDRKTAQAIKSWGVRKPSFSRWIMAGGLQSTIITNTMTVLVFGSALLYCTRFNTILQWSSIDSFHSSVELVLVLDFLLGIL